MTVGQPGSTNGRLVFLDAAGGGDKDPAIVGVKAANLMHLAGAGLPVPPGFVLSTEVCAEFHRAGCQLDPHVNQLLGRGVDYVEQATGRRFGAGRRPLLVAVRSGAAASMPGMLDTVLNVGLCDATLPGLLLATGDPAFVWDSYRRLIQAFADVVENLPAEPFALATEEALARHGAPTASELEVAALRDLVGQLKAVYQSRSGRSFPQDPRQQLVAAVEAVLRSWDSDRAVEYRRLQGLSGLAGTAVTVQAMVFGNLGATSGSGVAFTRNPATGANELYADFVLNGQGEDVVAGQRAASDPGPLIAAIPGLAHQLETASRSLEAIFGDVQDFEFTVEDGKLWLLQARSAKRTPLAALQIACDLVDEGLIDPPSALERLTPYDVDRITRTRLSSGPGTGPIGRATPASTGVASGNIELDVEATLARVAQGKPVILVREHASTDDIKALAACTGLLTATGARTSHAAVVARQLGIVCLIGCPTLAIDQQAHRLRIGDHQLEEGETITLDASTGNIYRGALKPIEERPTDLIERVHSWQSSSVPPV